MKVQLIIERNDNGSVNITGPITDKLFCYGLLDCARDAIKDFNDKAAANKSQISLAKPGDIAQTRLSFDPSLRNGR